MIRKITMLTATLALAFSLDTLCGEISLESSVQLEAQKMFVTNNVHGDCARASVTITGIDADRYVETASAFLDSQDAFSAGRNGYTSPAVEIVITEPPNTQKVAMIHLSELSLVRCVTTKNGKKVLIGTVCAGNSISCSSPNYYLIDAERIANPDTRPGCDANCINRKAGRRVIK